MCKHNRLKFIGQQTFEDRKHPLNLYNCMICKSTITLKDPSRYDILDGKYFSKLSFHPVLKLRA